MRRARVPDGVVTAFNLAVPEEQRIDVNRLLAILRSPAGTPVRAAWKEGERDTGRLVYLLSRHVGGFDEVTSYEQVVAASKRAPGRFDPTFLRIATAGGRSGALIPTSGGIGEGEMYAGKPPPFGESWKPVILGGVALATLGVLIRPPWKRG
jgi:hypothetical protein